jgi:hypothetical protein
VTIIGPNTKPTAKSRSQEVIESILDGIRELSSDESEYGEDVYILAAFVTWMRSIWRGSPSQLAESIDTHTYRWVLNEACRLRNATLRRNAEDVLRLAVTS